MSVVPSMVTPRTESASHRIAVTLRPVSSVATRRGKGSEHGLRHRSAATDRASDAGDVSHGVGQGAESGAR